MNLVEYAEQSIALYPVQRFVLKLIAGVPLDTKKKTIRITDMFAEKKLHTFSEAEYLKYLHNEGRASRAEHGGPTNITVLAMGMCKRLITSTTMSRIHLRAGEGSVELSCKTVKAKGLRGSNLFHVGLDEMALFQGDIFGAALPGQMQFHAPQKEGAPLPAMESTMLVTSTPRGDNYFPKLFRLWFHPEMAAGLSLRIPTWEMNPSLHSGFLREEYKRDSRNFAIEYGAEFSAASYADIEG